MDERDISVLCARMNASIDIKEFVDFLGYHPDRAIKSQGVYRMLCPMHGETVFRTLVLNPRRNTAHCEHTGCDAHRPCDLIELAMKVHHKPREQIVLSLFEFFGVEKLQLTPDLLEQLKELAKYASTPPFEEGEVPEVSEE